MKKRNMKSIIAVGTALMLSFATLTACGQGTTTAQTNATAVAEIASGGTLYLKVNPEIAISYDDAGLVTKVEARNDDGSKVIETYKEFEGKECRTVVSELVKLIGDAGYFVEEVEGGKRQITIEIESGSKLPSDDFLDDIADDVRLIVRENQWQNPLNFEGESDYGVTDYVDTDYGVGNDGDTDYLNDTDYGPNNDGVTDYDDTDYGPNNDGVTDYDDTDYGPNNDGVTDYDDTDYGPNNDGVTNYVDTDYGPNSDGDSDYVAPAPTPAPAPAPAPAPTPSAPSGDSGYSNYGGDSGYDAGSNYGDSGYDD